MRLVALRRLANSTIGPRWHVSTRSSRADRGTAQSSLAWASAIVRTSLRSASVARNIQIRRISLVTKQVSCLNRSFDPIHKPRSSNCLTRG